MKASVFKMEFDGDRYLRVYGFDRDTSRQEFETFILELYADKKYMLVQLIKNLIAIRLLQIAKNENGLRRIPKHKGVSINRVFKRKDLIRIANESEMVFPKLFMSGIASLILLGITILWIIFLIIVVLYTLFNNVELLFTGIDIGMVLEPFLTIILLLPVLGLPFLFKNFFALGTDGGKTFSNLIDKVFELNYKEMREDNFRIVVNELVKVQQDI